jgi:tRNA(Arg) A34 adenosine deaminase TadA
VNRLWSSLPNCWQLAFEAATQAYLEGGSAPIGAVLTGPTGEVLANGRNEFRERRLAHAELDALNKLPADLPGQSCSLFVTVEPCPMCTGAIRMAQLGKVSFAAHDPAAGFSKALGIGRFMRAMRCEVNPPSHEALEEATVAMVVEHRERTGHTRWRDLWAQYHPRGFHLGVSLAQGGAYVRWRQKGLSGEQLWAALTGGSDA